MDANQRSEANKQANNGGNEKGTPGAQGKTQGEGSLDHTYPKGAEAAPRITGDTHAEGSMQSGVGPGVYDGRYQRSDGQGDKLQGGSMQTQQTGGSGAQQGITDSHQEAMEQRSGAYGKLEQPVGDRPGNQGVSLQGSRQSGKSQGEQQSSTQGGGQRGPHSAMPRQHGGSMGQQSANPQGTQGGGQAGPGSDAQSVQRGGSMHQQSGPGQGSQGGGGSGRAHDSTDRIGSQTGNYQREMGVHQSNDLSGGLPRSPGNAGPYPDAGSTHQTGPDNHADLLRDDRGVHESNNSSGGLPRSPGGANQLSADEKMDDDTGFSNPRRRD